MPSGRVRWYDAKRGFGFITDEQGGDVFLPSSALPAGVSTIRKGSRVEFSVAEGRKGPQALDLKLVGPTPSILRAKRPDPDDMAAIVEDLIKLLDSAGNGLLATLLRAVADDFDVPD